MRGKKPKERQRYVLRVNETLVEVTRDVYLAWYQSRRKERYQLEKMQKNGVCGIEKVGETSYNSYLHILSPEEIVIRVSEIQELQEALKYLGRERELEGYYFGLYDLPDGMKRDTYHCYYFHPYGGLREKVFFNNCLFEAVFTAPHGMTLGYRREGEVYVPCYGTMGEERRQFVRQTEEWMMEYGEVLAKEMTKKRLLSLQISKERKTARKLLYLFMTTPSGEEARIYGQLSFSDDVLEEEGQPIAPRMTQRELRANHILPKLCRMAALKTPTVVKSVWYEGSAVLGRKHIKRHIRQHLLWQAVRFAVKAMEQTGQKKGGEKDD
mgnify:CR=1 FL=1